jgi:O-antigen/teichoic acid export membrane protein
LRRGSQLAALYSLPVAAVLVIFGRQIIVLWAGPDFVNAYAPLVVLLLGYTFVNIFYWNRAALLAFNRPVYPTLVNFAGMLIKVAGILVWGASGAIAFAALLAGYYIFTVGLAVLRVFRDVRAHLNPAAASP